MSDAKIPAGWYPDPQDTTSDPRPERWWDGSGWTATTRPVAPNSDDDTAVLSGPGTVIEGEVLQSGPAVRFPDPPTEAVPPVDALAGGPADDPAYHAVDWSQPVARKPSLLKRISRPVLITAAVAGLLGLAVGSGVTYLAVHNDGHQQTTALPRPNPAPPGHLRGGGAGGSGGSLPGFPGLGGGAGASGGGSGALPGMPGLGGSGGLGGGNQAIDLNNKIVLPVPAGWTGGTGGDGSAVLTIGAYTCPGAPSSGGSGGSGGAGGGAATCSLGGANTGQLQGTDVAAAAKADITAAANESYPNSKGHTELKSQAVTVDGRSGYLVRWKVSASQGNDGYVETVVFPSSTSGTLISLHLGFDIAAKAPDVSVMDTIVSGVTDFTGSIPGGGGSGAAGGGGTGGAST
ncbi:hypothetical protein P3T36_000293 [Kitasatospora sp. MAP12-15]|uniref:DUF2510 domain-containing protein n=1 Tax=unclassified Kitasatospora TaxID=2633591 RepID=UPI0024768DC2|nr:DUF2510 domain-containing protein [Kitasatospora sp. MAP12-44]MDH6109522.1 hypothetical protein [Kitasatospora sp. MAP12-44]